VTAEVAGVRNSGLDALRAAACLAVVLYHSQLYAGVSYGPLDHFVFGGDTGVWVFFSISGYLLYKPFLTRKVDLRAYALKRASRILPGYYLALLAMFVLTQNQLFAEHPLPYLAIAGTYDIPLRGFMGVAWTLSAELLFYVTLPLIAFAARGREFKVLAAIGAVSAFGTVLHLYTGTDQTAWATATYPLVFYAFVPGMLLAVLEARRPGAFETLASPPVIVVGLVYLVLGTVLKPLPLPVPTLLGTALVMGWLIQHPLPGARALAFAGGASYALYLWHQDLFITFGVFGLAIALVGSALSWRLVERPILDWAHRRAAAWRLPKLPTRTERLEAGTAGADT
jgi:peptidoglycan/LPS O-acetylase OafA/YrhL